MPGQGRAIEAGSFDADGRDLSVGAKPGEQRGLATSVRGELAVGQQLAVAVDDCGVVGVLVRVNAADDNARLSCHPRRASR